MPTIPQPVVVGHAHPTRSEAVELLKLAAVRSPVIHRSLNLVTSW